jgi:hypothetical protein
LTTARSNEHLTRREACLRRRVHVKGRAAARARGMIDANVETEENRAPGWPRANTASEWAGYLCVAPLVAGLAAVGLLDEYGSRELAQRATIAWGAALLAFSGAVHWGLALAGRLRWQALHIGAALVPMLIAAAAVLIGGQRALALLVIGFGGLWLYEHRVLGARLPPDYLNLRRQLSIAICLVLAFTMFVSEHAGLS